MWVWLTGVARWWRCEVKHCSCYIAWVTLHSGDDYKNCVIGLSIKDIKIICDKIQIELFIH